MSETAAKPVTVMFACRQNAGRSQIAAAIMKEKAPEGVTVLSAGTTPADEVHPETIQLLDEMGLSLVNEQPQILRDEDVKASDWVITMGCGESCPIYPGKQYEDWEVQDPSGQPIEVVRSIRDDIEGRVDDLLNRISQGL
ncbi:MAG: heat-shock protein HtpX [Actinomycetaceae bacterium]|nr:heat-shock protein HtpX [Actinomycetaceae bacterium]